MVKVLLNLWRLALLSCSLVAVRGLRPAVVHRGGVLARHFTLGAKGRRGEGDDAVTRRRNRRGRGSPGPEAETASEPGAAASAAQASPKTSVPKNPDGSASLEDMFGLGNEQLRELMEQELPVPREDLSTRKAVSSETVDKNKVFRLPDLEGFMADNADTDGGAKRNNADDSSSSEAVKPRVDRSNQEEYLRVLQLNPFADADDGMFLDEYDIIPSIFGSGKLLNIPVPYLQTGHGILLIITLLSALVYAPGNPLTEFPLEIRNFLKQGLAVTYSINAVLAVQAFFKAKAKNLPAVFWAAKCFLLGGVAFFEVSEAQDPNKLNQSKKNPADRKSKNRK